MPLRELDAVVAAGVMGCRIVNTYSPRGEHDNYRCACENFEHNEPSEEFVGLARYSTDIAAAWEVELKMISLGWISRHSASSSGLEWVYEMWTPKGLKEIGVALEDRAPYAICVAALRALKIELPW